MGGKSMDITGNITLRTLTRKSIVPYGRYKGMRVEELLNYKKMEVGFLYYNVQWISFTDDVLEEACIFESRRIEKPSVSMEKYNEYLAGVKTHGRCVKGVAKRIADKREEGKARRRLSRAIEDENLSKGVLQAINHGHVNR